MSADGNLHVVVQEFQLILLEKETGKKFLANYNKTRINIGHQHDRWVESKEALGVQSAC
jgi:hypothetical protein